MTNRKVYQRGPLKGHWTQKAFSEALDETKPDMVQAIMGGLFFINKMRNLVCDAMDHTDTQALTKEMLDKTVELFLKKLTLDLETEMRRRENEEN